MFSDGETSEGGGDEEQPHELVPDPEVQLSPWSIQDLLLPDDVILNKLQALPPTDDTVRQLVRDMRDEWINDDLEMTDLTQWALVRYGLQQDGEFCVDDFKHASGMRRFQYLQLLNRLI